jgi:serine/threonine protein kinase
VTLVALMDCPPQDADNELLVTATEVLGPMPPDMLKVWDPKRRPRIVDEHGRLPSRGTHGMLRCPLDEQMARDKPPGMSWKELDHFFDFLEKCLRWRPEDRASAAELLEDPWVVHYVKEPDMSEGKAQTEQYFQYAYSDESEFYESDSDQSESEQSSGVRSSVDFGELTAGSFEDFPRSLPTLRKKPAMHFRQTRS